MRLLLQLWCGHLILGRRRGAAWRRSEVLGEALLISHALRIQSILWCINPRTMIGLRGRRLRRKLLATGREGVRGGSCNTLRHASLAHLAPHYGAGITGSVLEVREGVLLRRVLGRDGIRLESGVGYLLWGLGARVREDARRLVRRRAHAILSGSWSL